MKSWYHGGFSRACVFCVFGSVSIYLRGRFNRVVWDRENMRERGILNNSLRAVDDLERVMWTLIRWMNF